MPTAIDLRKSQSAPAKPKMKVIGTGKSTSASRRRRGKERVT